MVEERNPLKSYSQYGEDVILQEIFGSHIGALLDIGAWDPEVLSNSRALIELGWKAVLIEPSPLPLANLARFYKDTPARVSVVQAAVALEEIALFPFLLTDDAVSSSEPGVQQTWKKDGGYYGKAWIATITLKDILNQFGSFDFVNVDTEGTSVPLAIQLLQTEMLPKVVIVEHDSRMVELMEVAQARGYSARHVNGTNVILERR